MRLQPVKKYWTRASLIYYILIAIVVGAILCSRYLLALSAVSLFLGISLIDFIIYRVRTRAYQEFDRLYFSDSPLVEREQDWKWQKSVARMKLESDTEYNCRWELVGRHEPRFQRILDRIGSPPETLIDIGCGVGKLMARIGEGRVNRMVGFDLMNAGEVIRKKSPGAMFAQSSAEAVPAANGVADIVVCSEVMEHLRNPEKTVQECFRVLRPGGLLVATVPNAAILPETPNPFVWMERLLTPFSDIRKCHKPHAVPVAPKMLAVHKLYTHKEFLDLIRTAPFQVEHIECVGFSMGPLELPFRVLRKIEKKTRYRFDRCFAIYNLLIRIVNRVLPRIPLLRNTGVSLLIAARRPED
ncbi:MAG: class I SAM-dependent methyltransferase [Planctomycetota bacterium]